MNLQIFALICLIFLTSCKPRSNPSAPDSGTAGTRTKREAIADEIVSNFQAFGNAVSHLNNSNAVEFAQKVDSLANRLKHISKDYDRLGPFPADLRKVTFKKLGDVDEALGRDANPETVSGKLQPEIFNLIVPAISKYYSVSNPLMIKSKLDAESNQETPRVETK